MPLDFGFSQEALLFKPIEVIKAQELKETAIKPKIRAILIFMGIHLKHIIK
jgi:hypothetical protein